MESRKTSTPFPHAHHGAEKLNRLVLGPISIIHLPIGHLTNDNIVDSRFDRHRSLEMCMYWPKSNTGLYGIRSMVERERRRLCRLVCLKIAAPVTATSDGNTRRGGPDPPPFPFLDALLTPTLTRLLSDVPVDRRRARIRRA